MSADHHDGTSSGHDGTEDPIKSDDDNTATQAGSESPEEGAAAEAAAEDAVEDD